MPVAEIGAHANLHVHDRIAAGVRNSVSPGQCYAGERVADVSRGNRSSEGFKSIQYGPADELGARRDAHVAAMVDVVAQSQTVNDDITGALPSINRNPVAELSLKHESLREPLVVQNARLQTDMARTQTLARIPGQIGRAHV